MDELIGKLKKGANLDDVKNVVKLNGSELQRKTQRDAPVDTGFLKRSIAHNQKDGGFTAQLGVGAEYAPYLIFGTRFMYAQDFFRYNYYIQRQIFLDDLKRLVE